jgi:hypothetical protein
VVEEVLQLSKLIRARRSPMSTVNNQHDIFLSPVLGELMDGSLFVGKPEVRRDHAHLNPIHIGRKQPFAV